MEEKNLLQQLEEAKNAVRVCLDHADALVGMHSLEYWAGEVERIRKKIRAIL